MEIDEDLLTPRAAHDGLSFEQLANSYNFRNISDRRRVFTRLLIDTLKAMESPTVLDIGCGRGMARDNRWQWAIKRESQQYWGLEPDASVIPPDGMFDVYEVATMDDAVGFPDRSIDVAYSYMVMEHVEDPIKFCNSLYRVLKPGGVFYFATPNLNHYFTRIALSAKLLGVSELAVRLARRDKVEEYHYPVQYRFNSEKQISAVASDVGFEAPEFLFTEAVGPRAYFPGPARVLFHLLAWKRHKIRRPNLLLTMIGRMRRPENTAA